LLKFSYFRIVNVDEMIFFEGRMNIERYLRASGNPIAGFL